MGEPEERPVCCGMIVNQHRTGGKDLEVRKFHPYGSVDFPIFPRIRLTVMSGKGKESVKWYSPESLGVWTPSSARL